MAENLKNQWLAQNNIAFQRVKRQLVEYSYRGQEDLPANYIRGLMESAIIEISRLQRELDSSELEIKQLNILVNQLKTDKPETVTAKDGE